MTQQLAVDRNMDRHEKVGFFKMAIEDIQCALHRDPAARNWFEVLVNYAGLHAIWFHRINHWLWQLKIYFLARWFSQIARGITGIEIHPEQPSVGDFSLTMVWA